MKYFNKKTIHSKPKSILCFKPIDQITAVTLAAFFAFSFAGCLKQNEANRAGNSGALLANKQTEELTTIYANRGLSSQTLRELQQVKEATAKYHFIQNAFTDQYVDINLKMPNMGYHFLKSQLVSPVFDLRKPPILVYNKRNNGSFELVAVEYAVPIDSSHLHTPPEGFTGNADEWDFNTLNTGWWTLHAWVWKFNPDGVFKPMNPAVIVK